MQIVVVHEGDPAAEEWIDRSPIHLLQVVLAGVVGRMRLTGEDQLQGASARVQNGEQAIGVVEDQLRTFVTREPACEPDCERTRIE